MLNRATLICLLIVLTKVILNPAQKIVIISSANATNPVLLNCSSSDEVSYSWEYNGKVIKDANSSSYSIAQKLSTGNYTCIHGIEKKQFYAINFMEPTIEHSGQSITATEGDTDFPITCISRSSTPLTFHWAMKTDDKMINLTEVVGTVSIESEGTQSVLKISKVLKSSRAYYECYAENGAGSGSTEMLLRVHDRLAPLWPFLGILVEIALIVILAFVFAKNSRNRQSAGQSTTFVGGAGASPRAKEE